MSTDKIVEDIPKAINEHARAIGYVCILWAAMESRIDQLLAALTPIDHDKIGEIFSANVDLREKLEIIKSAAFVRKPNDAWFKAVEELANKVDNSLRSERNRYVHDAWLDKAGEIVRRTKQTTIKKPQAFKRELVTFTDTPVPVEKIWALCAAIREVEVMATIYRLQYQGYLRESVTSPPKPP